MLKTHTHGNAILLDFHARLMEVAVDIAGRMARCKDYRAKECLARVALYTLHLVVFDDESVNTCFKMYLTARVEYLVAHGLDDVRKAVGTNVWMGIDKDVG